MFSGTPLIVVISNISTLAPFLSCTVLVWQTTQRKRFMVLWAFFASATITEIVVHIHSLLHMPNAWVIHIYTPIEYGFIAFVLSRWQTKPQVSKLMRISIPAYASISLLIKISGFENIELDTIDYLSRPLSFLLVSGFAAYTLHRLCTTVLGSPLKQPRFWFLLAIVVYYCGSTIIIAFLYIRLIDILWFLIYAHATLNILHNVLFTLGIFVAFHSELDERIGKPKKHEAVPASSASAQQ